MQPQHSEITPKDGISRHVSTYKALIFQYERHSPEVLSHTLLGTLYTECLIINALTSSDNIVS